MGGWGCGRCGGSNPDGTRFCGHCGLAAATPGDGDTDGPADERRLITALFADISGFTSLADKLDADELHEAISPVISLLAAVAERYDGSIAKYAGDALLVFFGAPVAHEDHAERALRVALEMHAELTRAREHLPPEAQALELHIGVNSGKVIAGMFGGDIRSDYSILGDAVNVAQRLEASAPSGETYVGESTRQLAAARFDLERLGGLKVKNKEHPVAAWRLVGERAAPERRTLGRGRFVGRDPELASAGAVVDGLAAGRGGAIGLTGEPGVGKSRMVDELRGRALEQGVAWLDGRCISYGAALPYWPYIALLRSALGIRIEDPPEDSAQRLATAPDVAAAGDAVAFFARLLGLTPPRGSLDVDQLHPEAFRRGLHQAFVEWLGAIADRRPTMLVVEDLHWADQSSLALTADLVRLAATKPLAICLTGRPEARQAAIDAADVAPADARVLLELAPLDRTATLALLESMLSGEPPAPLAEAVVARTEGNPFFAQEMVRSLLDDGTLVHEDGSWHLRTGWDAARVPATVEGVLSARMDLLPRAEATVLQMASVVGRQVRLALLDALAEDVPDVEGALGRLVDGGFLDVALDDGEELLVFHHALVVEVAYERLLRRQRRDLHRKVADVAEELYGTGDDVVDLMARHLYLAGAGVKAIDYLTRSAGRARRLFANDEAILHLERATELARTHRRAAARLHSIILELADLHAQVGGYQRAYDLYDEVRAVSADVEAWRGMASVLRRRGDFASALSVLDRAFAALDPTVARAPLWLEQGWTLAVGGLHDDSTEALQAGLAAADAGPSPVVGELLLQLAQNEDEEGLAEESLNHALEAQWLFEKLGDVRGRTSALRVIGAANRALGRLDEAARALRRGLELAQRTGSVEEVGGCLINLGMVELERGAVDAAIECDRRAIVEFEQVGHGPGRAIAHGNLAEKLLVRGDVDEAERYAQEALAQARAIGRTLTVADVTKTLAAIAMQQGRFEEAALLAEEAAQLFSGMRAEPSAAECLELAAQTLERDGDGELAPPIS